jgi:tRNA(adenine34) deaminase
MMARAVQLARAAAAQQEVPVGAVLYETASERVLAEAKNTRETDNDPCGHAELLALREGARALGDWRLNNCTLVVTLEPCHMCAGAIVNARVGRVVYGADDPKAGAVRSLRRVLEDPRLNHRVRAVRGVMAAECGDVLREFFKAKRRG